MLTVTATAFATPVSAAQFLFNFAHSIPEQSFSFSLDSDPVPDAFNASQFAFFGVPITTGAGVVVTQIDFFDSIYGGLNVGTASSFVGYRGPTLYSGPASNPHFLTGTFALAGSGGAGTLTISDLSSAVPEPGTWAMMIVGFGGVGSMVRASRRRNVVSAA